MASRAGVEQVVAVHIGFDAMNAETAPGYIAKIAGRYAGKIAIADDLDRF
jgi:hypothetical protein